MPTLRTFTREQEARLERGWPYLVELVAGHPHDAKADRYGKKYARAIDPVYFTEWPRELAIRFARTACDHNAPLTDGRPLTESEGRALLERAMLKSAEHYEFKARDYVFIIEALIGTAPTVEALTSAIEALPLSAWLAGGTPLDSYFKGYAALALGFMLGRAPPKVAASARKRLEKAWAKANAKKGPRATARMIYESLDVVLHDRAGWERTYPERYWLETLSFLSDRAFALEKLAAEDPTMEMSVYLAWRLGPDSLVGLANRMPSAAARPAFIRDFGMLQAPEIEEAIAEAGKSKAGREPAEIWLAKHGRRAKSKR